MAATTDTVEVKHLGEAMASYVRTVITGGSDHDDYSGVRDVDVGAVVAAGSDPDGSDLGAPPDISGGDRVSRSDTEAFNDYATRKLSGNDGLFPTGNESARRILPVLPDSPRTWDPRRPRRETIIGSDDRLPVHDSELYPWRMVVDLEIGLQNGRQAHGTGFMVGPRLVLTAGHCVYDPSMFGWAREITVLPGRAGTSRPFKEHTSSRLATVRQWRDEQQPDFDYGVIELAEDVGEQTGWFALRCMPSMELTGQPISVAGYPIDLEAGQVMYYAQGPVSYCDDHRVHYRMDTFPAESGGPAFLSLDDGSGSLTYEVVAIHTNGIGQPAPAHLGQMNSGTRIIPELIANVQHWLDQGVQ